MANGAATEEHHSWFESIFGVHPLSFGADKDKGTVTTPVGSATASLSFTHQIEAPKVELEYVDLGASITFAVSYKAADAGDTDFTVKVKDLKPKIEAEIKKKLGDKAEIKGTAGISDKKGSVSAGLDIPVTGNAKVSFEFSLIEVDSKKLKLDVAVLKASEEYTLIEGVADAGLKVKYSGKATVEFSGTPNKTKIAEYVAKRFGAAILEDGALAVGAVAAGVIGGIVGGVALTAGVCAAIGKLEDLGADATAVSQEGQRQVRLYAQSYGATMRGGSGPNPQGNADAEAALQKIIQQNPGVTRDQAVRAATESKQNYESLAYQALLPVMRDRVRAAYKQKEGWFGDLMAGNILEITINEFLGPGNHY